MDQSKMFSKPSCPVSSVFIGHIEAGKPSSQDTVYLRRLSTAFFNSKINAEENILDIIYYFNIIMGEKFQRIFRL